MVISQTVLDLIAKTPAEKEVGQRYERQVFKASYLSVRRVSARSASGQRGSILARKSSEAVE